MCFQISRIIFWAIIGLNCVFNYRLAALPLNNLPVLSADNPLEYDQTTQELVASGHAQFSQNQLLLESDTIRFSRENQIASIIGNPYVTSEGLRLNAEKIVYDLGKKNFKAYNYRCLQVSPKGTTYLKGPMIEGDSKLMFADRGVHYISLKGCSDPHPTDVSIWSRKIEYHAGEYIIGRHNFFMVGRVPVFYLP
jgi:lipopolysaccharide assembly outer membrane protein LptD (OstA)